MLFALLDDATAPVTEPRSRLFTGWCGEHRCEDPATLAATWAAVAAALQQGQWAVMLADYEWGARLVGATAGRGQGSVRWLLFQQCQHLTAPEVSAWLATQEGLAQPGPAAVIGLQADDDTATYRAAIDTIHDCIRRGETYQVNHTLRLRGHAVGSPLALYRRLRDRQPVPFGALITLPGDEWVLSCSPELFLRHEAGRLSTRPMKGTAPRHPEAEADRRSAEWLASDVKNRAENLMIVDLLRNDLGRIAQPGSVQVPTLFAIEPYSTVYQMTSTVQADLPPSTDVPEVLQALFPCGSITGAPKHRTVQLIEQLESSPRGLYTGSIGWIDAPSAAAQAAGRVLGDFCWSVAIRTVLLGPALPAWGGARVAALGVGGGIVLDSVAEQEAAEYRLKARFVTEADPGFTLFETLRVAQGQALRLDAHLQRLARSAAALGFACEVARVQAQVQAWVQQHCAAQAGVYRLRIDLHRDGRLQCRHAVLAPLPPAMLSAEGRVRVLPPPPVLATPEAALRQHKTSWRSTYDAAMAAAEAQGAFDQVFLNAAGELTEGSRSNVLVQLDDGRWYTPPVSAGVLPGVMRAALMADPQWQVRERRLTWPDVLAARDLAVCNALRGVLRAQVAGS